MDFKLTTEENKFDSNANRCLYALIGDQWTQVGFFSSEKEAKDAAFAFKEANEPKEIFFSL